MNSSGAPAPTAGQPETPPIDQCRTKSPILVANMDARPATGLTERLGLSRAAHERYRITSGTPAHALTSRFACRSCGSEALALLIAGTGPDSGPVLDLAADAADPSDGALDETAISALDASILAAHLDAWQGDLVGWLDAIDPASGSSRRPGAEG